MSVMGFPPSPKELPVPAVTADQMREVVRLAVEEFGVQLLQMVENASRELARLARRLVGGRASGRHVTVVAGAEDRGGVTLAAARHLANWGADVQVLCGVPLHDLREMAAQQVSVLHRLGVAVAYVPPRLDLGPMDTLRKTDLVLDGLVGCGLTGPPQGSAALLVQLLNASSAPVLSLDVPSGVDSVTGESPGACVRAMATLALALPRRGLARAAERGVLGTIFLADMGIPPSVFARVGLDVPPLFVRDSTVELGLRDGQWYVSRG